MTLPLVTLDYHRAVSSSFILSRLAEQIPRHVLHEEITNDENIALIIPIITIIEKTVNSNKENKETNKRDIHFNRTPRIPERVSSGFRACFR